MRLIDADKFKGKVIASHTGSGVIKLVAIDDVPTAYDTDKVVEQLEELRKECEDPLQDYDPNYFINKAIEIVKGGGINAKFDTNRPKKRV